MLWIIAALLVAILLLAYQGYAAKNYLEPNAPYYSGNYATGDRGAAKILTAVSYNIRYALNVEQAIAEIKEIRAQRGLDILLLQEMDEVGMEQVARELELNYVYYPAAIESTYRKNFGNAVLSHWPIVNSQKLILPHISFSNRMKRIATRATIQICSEEFVAYSIHTEPVFTLPQFKVDQYTAVLNDVDFKARHVIVGGDFNSFTKTEIEKMEQRYREAGFERASLAAGPTFARWGIRFSPDHVFAKGFVIVDVGKLSEAQASDHLPLWVTMTLKECDPLH
jgi:endonuclease/exonuclease/phosphatase family metal-dependent hydrolase